MANHEVDYGVVFSGGGALGAWEVGCYKAILEKHGDKKPFVVTGASAGALNAAAICAGKGPEDLQNLWKLQPDSVFSMNISVDKWKTLKASLFSQKSILEFIIDLASSNKSIMNTSQLETTLNTIFTEQTSASFIRSSINCVISSTDLTQGRSVLHYHVAPGTTLPEDRLQDKYDWRQIKNGEQLVAALMGTSALPVLFPPSVEGLFDGGVLHNQPITPALVFDATRIYVLIPNPEIPGKTDNLLNIVNTLLTTWLSTSLLAQVEIVKTKNVIRESSRRQKICLCIIRPRKALGANLLSFGDPKDLIANGYQTAHSRLSMPEFDPDNELTWY